MDKYIKLDDVLTTLYKYFPLSFNRQCAEDDLKSIPTADVEEVRRCKDCRYWGEGLTEEEKDEVRKLPMADLVCSWWSSDGCCPNDFCSNAKPKRRR